MREPVWFSETTNMRSIDDGPAVAEALRRVARGEVPLSEAMLTVAYYAGEQALAEADLLERETWALTALLDRCAPIWQHLADPILRFPPDCADQPRLELGTFAHLATLSAPSPDEQALITARTPCWARVSSALAPERAQQAGALAYSYGAISTAEAIAIVGFRRILSQLTAVTRSAGQALVTEAQNQRDRQAQLTETETMLGVAPEPAISLLGYSRALPTCLLLSLLRPVNLTRLALAGAIWVLVVIVASFLANFSPAMFLLLIGVGLVPVQIYFGAELASRGNRTR